MPRRTRADAGRKGGESTRDRHGSDYYRNISLMRKEFKGRPSLPTLTEIERASHNEITERRALPDGKAKGNLVRLVLEKYGKEVFAG